MELGLNGKVIFVAASSRGLGYGIAREAAREGARVVLGSRDQDALERAVRGIETESRGEAFGHSLDASSAASIRDWIDAGVARFAGLDGIVVNAGGPPAGGFESFDDDAWAAAFDLTLMSAVRMIRAAIPHMRANKGGSIVAITSGTVKEPVPILLMSNVMRSGVTSLVKTLSRELAPDGIRANTLVPGRIDTDRVKSLDERAAAAAGKTVDEVRREAGAGIPLGRYGSIEEFGKAGAFLLSDAAAYVTGESFVVDGGAARTVW